MPVIEREGSLGRGTLYCTLLYIGPDGTLLGKHRKLKPTAAERVIWGEGDGSTLTSFTTELGTVGGLICWENMMPMARMAMYGKGVESIWRLQRTSGTLGRPPCGISRTRGAASCSAATVFDEEHVPGRSSRH